MIRHTYFIQLYNLLYYKILIFFRTQAPSHN